MISIQAPLSPAVGSIAQAVLMTMLLGGIVFGIIALHTSKVNPAEEKGILECPSSTISTTVCCLSGRPLAIQKKYMDASTQKSALIIFTSGEPYVDSKKKRPEGPSGDDQILSSGEDQQPSLEETTKTGPLSSETTEEKSEGFIEQKIAVEDKLKCECLRKLPMLSAEEPVTCVCGKEHRKDQEDSCVQPHKRKTRRRRKQPSQTASAGIPSEAGSVSRSRSPRDNKRRSKTSHISRQPRGSPSGSRSRPKAKRKAKK